MSQKKQTQEFHDGQGDTQHLSFDNISPSLEQLFDTCLFLYKHLESTIFLGRYYFQQVANAQHCHSMLAEEVERLDHAEVTILVDDKDREQLLQELHDLQKTVPEWDCRDLCCSTLPDCSRH